MKLILPMAGYGTRLRPHTWSRPKPLLTMAGKTVLDHVMDAFSRVPIDEVVCIVGWLGDQIAAHMATHYDLTLRHVVQDELKGQAHAIHLAREHLFGPCMINWVDTLFEADLRRVTEIDADVVAYVVEVEDPRRFGVVVEQNGRVVQLIEKPSTCDHKKCVIGLYYIREGRDLIEAIEELMASGRMTRGEFYLTDALQVMIDRGARVVSRPVAVWEDCGTLDSFFHAHHYLLDGGRTTRHERDGCVIVPPVHIAERAIVERSIVGPYVSVGENATVRETILQDSIVQSDALISQSRLIRALVGRNAHIRGAQGSLNVGDDSTLDFFISSRHPTEEATP